MLGKAVHAYLHMPTEIRNWALGGMYSTVTYSAVRESRLKTRGLWYIHTGTYTCLLMYTPLSWSGGFVRRPCGLLSSNRGLQTAWNRCPKELFGTSDRERGGKCTLFRADVHVGHVSSALTTAVCAVWRGCM